VILRPDLAGEVSEHRSDSGFLGLSRSSGPTSDAKVSTFMKCSRISVRNLAGNVLCIRIMSCHCASSTL
jgi:hypothetical protein